MFLLHLHRAKKTTKHPRSYMENKSEWNVMVKQKISLE